MATTTQNDNRAKFLELRKQGISVADARNQTYGPPPVVADSTPAITTAPAPVPPVIAPLNTSPESATKSTNIAQREANIASRQATPAPVTPTPLATPAPVETNVTSAPNTPAPTQTPFQQAQAESEKIKAQNEAQMKLNTQQADLKAQERQQVAQETAKANTPVNQKDVLNALVSGVSVAPQNTAAYRNAQMQYKTYQKFSTMTPTQLVDNMKMGEIGTETAQLLASNPNYIKAKEDFDKFQKNQSINNMIKSVAEGATGKTTAVDHYQNASDAIAKKLGINETNADAFARIVSQDPETLQLTKTVSNIAKQLNTLNTERNAVYEDLKKQYPDLSASAIMTLMAGRTKEATAQIDALNSSLTLTQADLKMAMEMAKSEYDATEKDIAMQAQIAGEDRQMQNQLALSQAQFDQKLAQQTQLTNDPTTAITTMIDEYKKLGVPFSRSTQQVISDFQTSGKDLPTYLSELQGLIQSKPEYKRYQAIQQGQMSDAEKMKATQAFQTQSDIRNFAQQKELAKYNNDLNRQEFLFKIENDPEQKAKTAELEAKLNANKSLFDVLGKNVGTYEGNRGYDLAGSLGDPLPAGGNWTVKSIDTAGEQVGSIFIGGKGSKPWGNTVVMQDENGNEIRYSHLQDIGVKPGDVLGFGDIVGTRGNTGNVKGANGETLTAEQLKAGRGAHLDVEIKSNGKLLSNADQVSFLKGLKAGGDQALTDKQFTQYNQTKTGFKSEPIVKSFEEALIAGGDIIQSLGSENGPGDVGAVFNFMKSLDPNSTVREGEFALAAKSAGVWESFKNIPANKLEGTILTDKQRKDFGKLAMKYIESKGKLYDTKYNDMIKVLENQGVPKSYYPTRMTDYVNQYKGTQETTPTSDDPFGIR